MPVLPVKFITVIHQIDGWVILVKMKRPLNPCQDLDFRAFMNELGIPYLPGIRLQMALWCLEAGQSPTKVMDHYQVVVVSHGSPEKRKIEEFRQNFTTGLGYRPETLA